ncbi:MAG: class I SAM-dependent methyltransferase [Candidatus Binatia bacterium]
MPSPLTAARRLRVGDLAIDPSSYVDPHGFVFRYEGGLFRAIRKDHEDYYRGLFANGTIDRLHDGFGLVESRITSLTIPEIECSLVLQHREIAPLNYCTEWCPSMLKAASVATLELNLELIGHGAILQDAYPWNIVFEGPRPVFVDFTSIAPVGSEMLWPAYQQFLNFFSYPLRLCADGQGKVVRLMLQDHINGIGLGDLYRCLGGGFKLRHPVAAASMYLAIKAGGRVQSRAESKSRMQSMLESVSVASDMRGLRERFLKGLLAKAERVKVAVAGSTWRDYYDNVDADTGAKVGRVRALLEALEPRSVLDVGCNTGCFSILAAESGAKVTAIDSSEECVEALYRTAETRALDVLPLIADVTTPTPALGHLGRQFPSLIERVRSEVVLCLGLMHHLHVVARQSFDRIAALFEALASKAVIFEYVDSTDGNMHLIDHGRRIEYSLETVTGALERYFSIRVFDSDRPTRRLLLCTKNP